MRMRVRRTFAMGMSYNGRNAASEMRCEALITVLCCAVAISDYHGGSEDTFNRASVKVTENLG